MSAPSGHDPHRINDLDSLQRIYGTPAAPSLIKEVGRLTPAYRRLVEAATFVIVASSGPDGLDCSPRGDAAGFVRVEDDTTLLIPDRRGNNRIDTLRNIIADPRIALLFLIPGKSETLRVNGRAAITVDPELLASFSVGEARPRSVLKVTVERVYFQCARAILRSNLWSPQRPSEALPSVGDMLNDCKAGFDGAGYDAELPRRLKDTLY